MKGVLSEYYPTTWFHPVGILKVKKRFEHRLPDVRGKLFITLTIDRSKFSGPEVAFDVTRPLVRKLLDKFRNGIKWEQKLVKYKKPYCVKLEFHKDEWPHYHLIVLTRRFIPPELLEKVWGWGYTHVGRIKSEGFSYLLKYVTKSQEIPKWVLGKNRIRIFQASPGFLRPESNKKPKSSKPSIKKSKEIKESNIGKRLAMWAGKAKFTSDNGMVSIFDFETPFRPLIHEMAHTATLKGDYLGEGKFRINNSKDLIPWILKAKEKKKETDSGLLELLLDNMEK